MACMQGKRLEPALIELDRGGAFLTIHERNDSPRPRGPTENLTNTRNTKPLLGAFRYDTRYDDTGNRWESKHTSGLGEQGLWGTPSGVWPPGTRALSHNHRGRPLPLREEGSRYPRTGLGIGTDGPELTSILA